MAEKKRVALELGQGTSLRSGDYTRAAVRAVKDALWHNSLTMAQAFGAPKEAMIVDVEIAVQQQGVFDLQVPWPAAGAPRVKYPFLCKGR